MEVRKKAVNLLVLWGGFISENLYIRCVGRLSRVLMRGIFRLELRRWVFRLELRRWVLEVLGWLDRVARGVRVLGVVSRGRWVLGQSWEVLLGQEVRMILVFLG